VSDVTRRLSRWKAKYSPEIAQQTTTRIYAEMSERYQASLVALCAMETDTKQVLSASGIDTMLIVFYLDFARQLFRLSHGRTISGGDAGKGSAGATGEMAESRPPARSARRDTYRRLQRPRADPVAAGHGC